MCNLCMCKYTCVCTCVFTLEQSRERRRRTHWKKKISHPRGEHQHTIIVGFALLQRSNCSHPHLSFHHIVIAIACHLVFIISHFITLDNISYWCLTWNSMLANFTRTMPWTWKILDMTIGLNFLYSIQLGT